MQERDRILESHQDNDGIKEYDNPLPNWFMYLFLGSIVFAFLYFAYYFGRSWSIARVAGVGVNLSNSGADYLASVRTFESEAGKRQTAEPVGEALLALLKAPPSISQGEAVFRAQCVACHGDEGQGVVGPNLADAYWIHGGSAEALIQSIATGFPEKGMPAWKPVLGMDKVRQAAAYVMSIRGRPVKNPKAPQGTPEP